nr:hypothetical protein Iba_chr14bCG7720 [Ipomoea batatas]
MADLNPKPPDLVAEITRQVLADLWDRGYRIPPGSVQSLETTSRPPSAITGTAPPPTSLHVQPAVASLDHGVAPTTTTAPFVFASARDVSHRTEVPPQQRTGIGPVVAGGVALGGDQAFDHNNTQSPTKQNGDELHRPTHASHHAGDTAAPATAALHGVQVSSDAMGLQNVNILSQTQQRTAQGLGTGVQSSAPLQELSTNPAITDPSFAGDLPLGNSDIPTVSVPHADSLNNNAFFVATLPTVGNGTVPTVTTNVSSVPTVVNASGIHGLNALNNANIGSVLPTGANRSDAVGGNVTVRTLHGLDSINNATVSNMPIGDISNHATNIPSSAIGGNSRNNSNNNTTANNVPSGGGTKNNSNILARQRVTFRSNLQPANRANAQDPGTQNQAQEGTGLTKSQKRTLAKKRRREKGKDPIIDVGLGNFSVPQVAVGVGTSTNPMLGLSQSQPVAPIPISTCNTFTLLQDVNETVLAERAHTQEDVHDTTLATQAHTQEATTKDFDAELDDHLTKVLDQEGVPQVQPQEEPQVQSQNDTQTPVIAHTPTRANNEDAYSSPTLVEDSSTQGDASSAAPISMGLQTPATIPTVSPVAHNTKAPVTKRTRRTRSASEQSNVAGFYREASDDDDDSDSSVAGRVAIFESAGRNREFVGGHGSPPKTSKVPFGGRITRSQVRLRLDSFRLRLGFDSAFAGVDDKLWLFLEF